MPWWYDEGDIAKKVWRTDGRTEPFIELLGRSKEASVKAIFQIQNKGDSFPIVMFLDTVKIVVPNFVTRKNDKACMKASIKLGEIYLKVQKSNMMVMSISLW